MDKRECLGNDKALKRLAGVNRRCRGGMKCCHIYFSKTIGTALTKFFSVCPGQYRER
jgi:hypothetical protein